MGLQYKAVGWNPQKKAYDRAIGIGIGMFLLAFLAVGALVHPEATAETLLIRGFGTCAYLLLSVVLAIGPLCRLDRRFLPVLYNRRHLGVATFLVALVHGGFSLFQFHALGNENPFVSLLTSNTRWTSLADFPFQPLGFIALLVLLLMAATSHDFWLANLTAPVWKAIHMGVYAAYALVVLHVCLGILQAEQGAVWTSLALVPPALVLGLHLTSAWRERAGDRELAPEDAGFVDVCAVEDIPHDRALTFVLAGERVAVFRYGDRLSALSAVCQHQNGPLGEGRVIDGCVTCPWHGYQYDPASGRSPEPFTEKVPTFRVRVRGGRALVEAHPQPPGTELEPARCSARNPSGEHE